MKSVSKAARTHSGPFECGCNVRWGLMFHYIDKPASSNTPSSTTAEQWNRRVDSFDVGRFAGTVKKLGAGHVLFTLGQNTGHFCSPNKTYDRIAGIRPSKLSRRDLIAEIAEALLPEVRLIAYLPSHAPANDDAAVERFCLNPPWDAGAWGLPPHRDGGLADGRLSEFQRKWEAVVAEWGERWGNLVSGWWIDGCYFAKAMYGGEEEPNGESFARALRAGNPGRVIAFNTGTTHPFEQVTASQDYTAGEVSAKFPVTHKWEPLMGEINGMQMHVLSYLGDWWGAGSPRFPDSFVEGYTRHINSLGGVMTWDVPIGHVGDIPADFRKQLEALNASSDDVPAELIGGPA